MESLNFATFFGNLFTSEPLRDFLLSRFACDVDKGLMFTVASRNN